MNAYAVYTYDNKRHKRKLFVDPSMDFVYAHHALVANPFDNPYIVAIHLTNDGDLHICVADKKD